MPIINRPQGEAQAVGQAGEMIGKADKAKEQKVEMYKTVAEERAMNWELQKMEINSQQQFSHELRLNQADLEKEARSKEWEVEKMEISSRIDFERKEKDRQQKLADRDAQLKAIDDSDVARDNPELREMLKFKVNMKFAGYDGIEPEDVGFVNTYKQQTLNLRERELTARESEIEQKYSPEMNDYKKAMVENQQSKLELEKKKFEYSQNPNVTEYQKQQLSIDEQRLDLDRQRLEADTESKKQSALLGWAQVVAKSDNLAPKEIQQMGKDVSDFETKYRPMGDGTWRLANVLKPEFLEKRATVAEVTAYNILKDKLNSLSEKGTPSFSNTIGGPTQVLSMGSGDPNVISFNNSRMTNPTAVPNPVSKRIQKDIKTGAMRVSYNGGPWQPYKE